MASTPRSNFPQFLDGDVSLYVSTTQHYKLHSQVLSAHSTFFAKEIAAKPGARLNAQARRENSVAYRFDHVPSAEKGEPGHWVRMDVNEQGRTPKNHLSLLPDFDNGKVENTTHKAWEWVFGIFYNLEPSFVHDTLAKVLGDVVVLIECAESIGSLDHVRDVVDLSLLRQDAVLWSSVMGNPVAWIELSRRVRSPQIFKEAAIHLIGQWGVLPNEVKETLGEDIRELLERKAYELDLAKEAIELRILGHYPHFMLRTAADKPGRPSYSNDIYMWMCVCFFRQWLAQSISDDRTRRAPDGGLNFYAALFEGGQAYLTHMDFQEFHRYFPMSIKACHVLEANMGVLKEDVKKFIGDLMVEQTHLKRDHCPGITWLTCASVKTEDCPWHVPKPPGRDEELQNIFDELDNQNDVLVEQENHKQAAAASAAAEATASRPRKRQRIIDEDDEDEGLDDEYRMFIPERPRMLLDDDYMEEDE